MNFKPLMTSQVPLMLNWCWWKAY